MTICLEISKKIPPSPEKRIEISCISPNERGFDDLEKRNLFGSFWKKFPYFIVKVPHLPQTNDCNMAFLSKLFSSSRGEEIKALAPPLNMVYRKQDHYGLVKLLGGFQLFRSGSFKKITHILSREDEWLRQKTAIFDYQYTVQAGKTPVTFFQTVFFIESKDLALPQFLMKPEHFFHRIGKFMNLTHDIEFEAYPAFSEKYLVQGEIPALVKASVPEELARFFTIENKWSLEGINYHLIFYQKHKRLPPETIREFYQKGMQIAEWLKHNE